MQAIYSSDWRNTTHSFSNATFTFLTFPNMLINEQPLRHWMDYFYGYGSWQAPLWFVGYEEGGGDLPEEVAEKLNYFQEMHGNARQATLCDMRALYRKVTFRIEGPRAEKFQTLFDHRFGSSAVLHGGWKNLIAFAHGYKDKKFPDLLSYQQKSFASKSEAMIPFYPLPSSHNHAWYYAWLDQPHFPFLKTRAQYEEHVYPQRIQTLLEKINEHHPKLVLMYGMTNINQLKKSVQEAFPEATFTQQKAIPLEIPQYHCAGLKGTTLLITTQVPTLRHNRIETGFDWLAFGKSVKAGK